MLWGTVGCVSFGKTQLKLTLKYCIEPESISFNILSGSSILSYYIAIIAKRMYK